MKAKQILSDFFSFCADFWRDFFRRVRSMDIVSFAGSSLSVLLICAAFALFSGLRRGIADTYMGVFIPLFLANLLIVFYGAVYGSSSLFPILISFLLTAGTALQIFMLPVDEITFMVAESQIAVILFGIMAAAVFVPAVSFVLSGKTDSNRVLLLLIVSVVFLYGDLLLFGTTINGSRSWRYWFNSSIHFQITEAVKLVSYLFCSVCMSAEDMSAKRRSRWLFALLAVNSLCMVAINELGTLIVICLVCFMTRSVFSDRSERGYVFKEIMGLFLVFLALFLFCFCVYETRRETDPAAVSQNRETDSIGPVHEIADRVALIYPKTIRRVSTFLQLSDSEEDNYQREMADQALKRVTWFGTPKGSLSRIPEISTDFIFIYYVVRLGAAGTALLMAALLSAFFEVLVETAKPGRMRQERAMAVSLAFSLVFQSLLCASSNIGLFPVVGLPFPFLSSGGSSMCINLFTVLYLLFFMRKNGKEASV